MLTFNFIAAMALLIITGYIDGQAFDKAAQIWQVDKSLTMKTLLITLGIFNIGLLTFFASLFFSEKQGITNSVVLTLVWFVVTIISLAFITGRFFELSVLDKGISLAVVLLIGLLYVRGISA